MQLPTNIRIRFVGDLHLGDGSPGDAFGRRDAMLVDFLRDCEERCHAVVFMGDALDLPQAWRVGRIRQAHPRGFEALTRLSQRLPVYFIRGNHDWTADYARLFPAASACERLLVGPALVWHGHQLDRFCHPERRGHYTKTMLHHLAERCFGFAFRVPLHEFNTWQNRVAHWLGAWYGRHLRRLAPVYRRLGLPARADDCEAFIAYWSRSVWGDAHALFKPAFAHLNTQPQKVMLCGHTHLPGDVRLGEGRYVNAGSWAHGGSDFAQWDGQDFCVLRWETGAEIQSEAYGWMSAGLDPGDFFTWWDLHYRGRLRYAQAPIPVET